MPDQDSNPHQEEQPTNDRSETIEPAERQTAASVAEGGFSASTATGKAQPGTSPVGNIEGQKLLGLLKNPAAALNLQPQTEWLYGAIGAAAGVLGFYLWVTFIHETILDTVMSGNLGGIVFWGILGIMNPGKFLVVGLFSIALLVGSLTLVGNWVGARNRSWMEAVTFQGGTQLLFGAGWLVAGLIAFLSASLSMLIGVVLLLISLLVLVVQALELHEVGKERKFLFLVYSIAAYVVLLFLVYSVIA